MENKTYLFQMLQCTYIRIFIFYGLCVHLHVIMFTVFHVRRPTDIRKAVIGYDDFYQYATDVSIVICTYVYT